MKAKTIYVTQPYLPPLEEFTIYLKKIWESKQLTNGGPFHEQFEKELANYLGVKYLSLFSNGTLALITALQSLHITGEVITTPFSFVATTHALWWNNIKPVFVDIEEETFNLNQDKIESAITSQTTAILPVHVYGNPCNVEAIKKIADRYALKIIYDACHTFGARLNGTSISDFGDVAVLSFHATKVFTTFEGGAIVSHDETTKKRIDYLKNFGFADEVTIVAPGINAKMNEVEAAFGLLNLKYVEEAIAKRKFLVERYRECLKNVPGIKCMHDLPGVKHNYPYFPIRIDANYYGKSREEVYELLKQNNIYTRRYFYPLISNIPAYYGLSSAAADNLPVASKIAREVLCLPLYPNLTKDELDYIVSFICNT